MSNRSCALCSGIAVIVFASAVAVVADSNANWWHLASPQALLAATGGDDVPCNVKCAAPQTCGGASFDCATQGCTGFNPCNFGPGIDNYQGKFCPACDTADTGKYDCRASAGIFCKTKITCMAFCQFTGGLNGVWQCKNDTAVGQGQMVRDNNPSGDPCP
jgi:hypothetical protein